MQEAAVQARMCRLQLVQPPDSQIRVSTTSGSTCRYHTLHKNGRTTHAGRSHQRLPFAQSCLQSC